MQEKDLMSPGALSSIRIAVSLARFRGCLFLLLISISFPATAVSGSEWLLSQLDQNGSISSVANIATTFQSTAEAIRVPAVRDGVATTGIEYLHAALGETTGQIAGQQTEQLARFIIAAGDSGVSATDMLSELDSRQNSDGGFG